MLVAVVESCSLQYFRYNLLAGNREQCQFITGYHSYWTNMGSAESTTLTRNEEKSGEKKRWKKAKYGGRNKIVSLSGGGIIKSID